MPISKDDLKISTVHFECGLTTYISSRFPEGCRGNDQLYVDRIEKTELYDKNYCTICEILTAGRFKNMGLFLRKNTFLKGTSYIKW